MIPDHVLHATPVKIDEVSSGLHGEGHGGRCRLMQEIRRVLNGGFLALDMAQERLDFFHPDGIRFPPELGLLEVPLERFALDFQCLKAALEIVRGRLADLLDFLFQFFKFGFCFQDLFRK